MLDLLFCGEFLLYIPCWLLFFLFLFLSFFFLSGQFLLHIPYWIYFSVGSLSYTAIADFVFMWGISLAYPDLPSFLSGEFLLQIPCWLRFFLILGVSLTHPVLVIYFILLGEFLLYIPCWVHFLLGEFLLHIPCWLHFYLGSFSYTSHVGFTFLWGVYRTHPLLTSFLCEEFLLQIPFCFIFIWGVSLTHPMLASFLSGEFLLHISRAGFVIFVIGGVSLTHSMLDLLFFSFFFSFLNLWSFSYTSRTVFYFFIFYFFIGGVFLTHPLLVLLLSREFLIYFPRSLHFYVGSFSYASHAGFFLCGEFL